MTIRVRIRIGILTGMATAFFICGCAEHPKKEYTVNIPPHSIPKGFSVVKGGVWTPTTGMFATASAH